MAQSYPAPTHIQSMQAGLNHSGIMRHPLSDNASSFYEQKLQRLENDNYILYQQNDKMKTQYKQGTLENNFIFFSVTFFSVTCSSVENSVTFISGVLKQLQRRAIAYSNQLKMYCIVLIFFA